MGAGRHLSLNVVGSTSEVETKLITEEFQIGNGPTAWASPYPGGDIKSRVKLKKVTNCINLLRADIVLPQTGSLKITEIYSLVVLEAIVSPKSRCRQGSGPSKSLGEKLFLASSNLGGSKHSWLRATSLQSLWSPPPLPVTPLWVSPV